MRTSESLAELAPALAKAQRKMKGAVKDSLNPHFKSAYSDLASVLDAIREPFGENGLSLIQGLSSNGIQIICTTRLLHQSGQWIEDELGLTPQQPSPQAAGSCATYLRRYTAMAMAGIASIDDDGHEASHPPQGNNYAAPKNTTSYSAPQQKDPDQPSTSKFDPTNPAHQMAAKAFLEKKKKPQMLAEFMTLMTGQTTTSLSLEATWQRMQNARE